MGRYARKLKRRLQRTIRRISHTQRPSSSSSTTDVPSHAASSYQSGAYGDMQPYVPAHQRRSRGSDYQAGQTTDNIECSPHQNQSRIKRGLAFVMSKLTSSHVEPSDPFGHLSVDQTRGWIKMQGSKIGIAAIDSYERSNKSIRTFLKKPLTRRQKRTLVGVFAALIALIVISVLVTSKILDFSKDPSTFKAWADEQPILASIGFMFMMMVQIIIAFIPGEPLQILAGYGFGFWWGTALCLLGAMLGSSLIFLGTKRFGTKLLFIFFSPEELEKLSFFNDPKRRNTLAFILMFIPGAPKDLISYVVGLTPMKLWTWLLISTVARSLGVIGSTIMGASVASNNHLVAIVIALIAIVCSLLGIMYYRNLVQKEETKRLAEAAQQAGAQASDEVMQAALATTRQHALHRPKQGASGYAPFELPLQPEQALEVLKHLEEIAQTQEAYRSAQPTGVLQRLAQHNPLRTPPGNHNRPVAPLIKQPDDSSEFSVPLRSAKGISNDATGAIKVPRVNNDATGTWRMPKH